IMNGKLGCVNPNSDAAGPRVTVVAGQCRLPAFIQLATSAQSQWMCRNDTPHQQLVSNGLNIQHRTRSLFRNLPGDSASPGTIREFLVHPTCDDSSVPLDKGGFSGFLSGSKSPQRSATAVAPRHPSKTFHQQPRTLLACRDNSLHFPPSRPPTPVTG